MPTMHLKIVDDVTGAPLSGAAVSGIASTSCCSNSSWPNSCTQSGGCNSGAGYNITVNSDGDGVASWDEIYSCGQDFDITISAPGYSNTHLQLSRGETSADDYQTAQLTPLQNVSQSNQGVGGSASGGASQGATAASSGFGSLANDPMTLILIIALIVGAVVVVAIVARGKG